MFNIGKYQAKINKAMSILSVSIFYFGQLFTKWSCGQIPVNNVNAYGYFPVKYRI